jgi:hypothetical protein
VLLTLVAALLHQLKLQNLKLLPQPHNYNILYHVSNSKKAKFFDFMKQHTPAKAPTAADAAVQYDLFTTDAAIASCELRVFNDVRFSGLRPLARKLFTAPASSAAIVSAYSAKRTSS